MPELPEVETIRKSLHKIIIGKTINHIEILSEKQFTGDKQIVKNKKITEVGRKGKVLYLKVDENKYLNFHLKMSGQLLYAQERNNAVFKNIIPLTKTNKLPTTITRIIIDFTDKSALFFNDIRKFGWLKISDKRIVPAGVDVLSHNFTLNYFRSTFSTSRKPIKTYLLDQTLISGIGNIYANDCLYEAKIHPEKKVNTLTEEEIERLYNAIKLIVKEAIKYKGSSAKDENYILPDSSKGSYQYHFRVYHRTGKQCFRCGNMIKRIKQAGRSSFLCSKCQIL